MNGAGNCPNYTIDDIKRACAKRDGRIAELEKELYEAKYLLFRVYDRLWTSSPDSAKVLEVQRLLKDVRHPAREGK